MLLSMNYVLFPGLDHCSFQIIIASLSKGNLQNNLTLKMLVDKFVTPSSLSMIFLKTFHKSYHKYIFLRATLEFIKFFRRFSSLTSVITFFYYYYFLICPCYKKLLASAYEIFFQQFLSFKLL